MTTPEETFQLAVKMHDQTLHLDVYERMALIDMLKCVDVIRHNEQRARELAEAMAPPKESRWT